ncbi:PREDICTED: serine/threonine-protein phosphatase 6 regulatory ankyrin repeat subunit A-like [Amphimedon queenslandica]|nr:PREDICTED: serine/threonine-protein phosphatase 6 regulatory ankyrin repeat subunit A-like [Amphimedon queenslandica]|eukprot:XP_011408062.1 PREDICTED: serine/threonine-protein phosphatase 6 regulatory ankyrin repeat subunit A-like [Amphimedon queenslandica]
MSDSVELLEYLQKNYNTNLNKRDRFGKTPLHVACQYAASSSFIMKTVNMFRYKVLLEADYSGCSSLHYLCSGLVDKYCITEVYNKLTAPCDIPLVNKLATFNEQTKEEWQKCIVSLNININKQHARVILLSTLLKQTSVINNFDINSITATGQSLVHLACTSGSILLAKVLEEYGINTSSLDYEGRSAVHYAALSGSPTLLSYTVSQYSLNASQPDYKGVVPLALACMSGSINAVEYIINTTDIDINITCDEGKTPFHYSCSHGHLKLSQYLCEVQGSGKADGYSIASGNMKLIQYLIENHHLLLTPELFLHAVNSAKLPLIKLLIDEYKLDPHVKGKDGKSAVHSAAQTGVIDVLDYLVNDCSCDLDESDGDNRNIFCFATEAGHYPFIKYIIDIYPKYPSLLRLNNDESATPLQLACSSGVVQLVTFLIDKMNHDDSAKNMNNLNCVTWACASGNLDLLKLLIKQYEHNPRIYTKVSPLNFAAMYGHVHILEWVRQEYHINVVSFMEGGLPFTAAHCNHLHCLKHLLNNYSFDINTVDDTKTTILHITCQKGLVAIVLYLTSLPQCDVSAKTSNGSTVLHLSCKSRFLPVLKHLVEEHQLDLTIKDYNGMAPVHIACEEGSLSIVKYIIDHSPLSLDMTDSFGRTPLLIAAFSKNLSIIRYLNSKNCNISILDDKGFNVIHISAKGGSLDILRFFINGLYCNPDITDASGRTPLYLSAQEGHLEIVEYLLDSPSYNKPRVQYIDMPDSNGNTALHAACSQGHPDIVFTIAEAYKSLNIDIYSINEKRQTPLHLAAANGHVNSVVSLLSATTGTTNHVKLLGAVDDNGCSSLHLACQNGHYRMALYLSEVYPANIYSVNNDEEGLLHGAAESGNKDLIQLLVESHGLDPESQDKDGVTCLHIIAKQGDKEIYEYLVPRVRNNPTPKDKSGRSPLHYASRHYEISVYLIQSFNIHPEDKDSNGFTGLHAACQAGNMQLVLHYLNKLNCNRYLETYNSKGLLYFACLSGHLEMVRILIEKYQLKPVQGDIDAAQSIKGGESIVKLMLRRFYFVKLVREMIKEAERRQIMPIATKTRPSFLS